MELQQVHIERKDYSISELAGMLRDGDIKTDPDYQREYIYDDKKASSLVESILMGIPIPILYLSEENDYTYEVIDGQQRIISFVRYYNNEFRLKLNEQSSLFELNGKKFKELDKIVQNKYKKCSLSAIVILEDSKELKYDIFERLNQGSVQLKAQEIRNCIYRGNLNNMIKKLVRENKDELSILFQKENKRMFYEELVLKFFTVSNYRNVRTSIKDAMNKYMSTHKNIGDNEANRLSKQFLEIFRLVKSVLGTNAFNSYSRDLDRMSKEFNSAIYDSIMVSFSYFRKQDIINNADEIRDKIMKIKKIDDSYDKCIRMGTSVGSKLHTRIEIMYNAIKEIIERNPLNIYDTRCFTEEQKKSLFFDGCKCGICGQTILNIEDCEVDHIVPYSKGGRTILENAQLVHSYCNKSKGNREY